MLGHLCDGVAVMGEKRNFTPFHCSTDRHYASSVSHSILFEDMVIQHAWRPKFIGLQLYAGERDNNVWYYLTGL